MKKLIWLAIILVVVLVLAPWGIGMLAEQRVNSGLDRLVKEAKYLTLVDRKLTRGWFASDQEVTFEIGGPWLDAMNPVKVMEEIKKAEGAKEAGEQPPADDAAAQSEAPAEGEAAAEPGAPAEGDAAAQPDAPPAAAEPAHPLRFTVRNHILHGPVLWDTGLGVARVDTHLVLSEEIRKKLAEFFGEEDPVRMRTRVAFFGGGTTTFSGNAHTYTDKGDATEVSWDKYSLAISYSSQLNDIGLDGKWPKLAVKNGKNGSQVEITGVTLTSDNERVKGDLYDTDFDFSIAKIDFVGEDRQTTHIAKAHYIIDSDFKGDFMSLSAKLGAGAVESNSLKDLGLEIEEVHYDFGFNRLHADTLAKMMTELKEINGKPVATVVDINAAMMDKMKQYGLQLLNYDPEFVIDRFGLKTPQGEGFIKGVIRLKGATAADFESGGAMGLVNKIEADITFEADQRMIEKFPNGATAVGAGVDSGYLKKDGGKVTSHIEFKAGELKVNGKAQGIPGLGGPPPPQ